MRPRTRLASVALFAVVLAVSLVGQSPRRGADGLPMPVFHHIHINSVDPARALAWYQQFWPRGRQTTWGGFPAFFDDIYLLYTKVSAPPPGAFDRRLQRSVPQSAFWTFGSTFTDTVALVDRFSRLGPAFGLLPVYTGPDDETGVIRSALGPYGDRLLTPSQLRERAARGTGPEAATGATGATAGAAPGGNQDFGYLVDPDGMLVEFNKGPREDFWGHHHYWHELPLCAANWYVDHLGLELSPVRDPQTEQMTPRARWDPCDVPVGEVSYPSFIRAGKLRNPIGTVRFANGSWAWYTRQCRFGRCGAGNDQPLSRSRGQVVDHIALAYPDLDAVIAHMKARGVPIVRGPYTLADTRAILIEDLDGLGIELLEARR